MPETLRRLLLDFKIPWLETLFIAFSIFVEITFPFEFNSELKIIPGSSLFNCSFPKFIILRLEAAESEIFPL